MRTAISPLQGEPHTVSLTDENGEDGFEVRAQALSAKRARAADGLGKLSCMLSVIVVSIVLLNIPDAGWLTWLLIGAPFLTTTPHFQTLWAQWLKQTTTMRFTEDRFGVLRYGVWQTHNRRFRHSFAIIEHDDAENERRQHEFTKDSARARGRAVSLKPYFGDTFIVVLEILGQRYDLIEVYGRKEAMTIVARLRACDEIIEGRDQRGRGAALVPADEWGVQAGDLED